MYLFPKIDLSKFNFEDDGDFVLQLLEEQRILVTSGSGFNFTAPDHFRIVFLPDTERLGAAIDKIALFLEHHRI